MKLLKDHIANLQTLLDNHTDGTNLFVETISEDRAGNSARSYSYSMEIIKRDNHSMLQVTNYLKDSYEIADIG